MIKIQSDLPQDLQPGINGETFTLIGKGVTEVPEELGRAWLPLPLESGHRPPGRCARTAPAMRGRK